MTAALQWHDEPEEAFREWALSALCGPGVSSTNRADVIADIVEAFVLPSSYQWAAFHEGWTMCDAVTPQQVERIFACFTFDTLGTAHLAREEQAFFDNLPEVVEVFRGAPPDRKRGYAWTTDEAVAERFARGHRGIPVRGGTIYRATIEKPRIWTVFTERGEGEIFSAPTSKESARIVSLQRGDMEERDGCRH